MKLFVLVFVFACAGYTVNAQSSVAAAAPQTEFVKPQTVEASCGTCMFKMDGTGCELAIRMDGKSYFVDGTTIHKHGDAHGENGFCNAIRKAEVTGSIVKDRFVVTNFKLLPVKE
ncbi:MAG: DUF6370 family protein [Ferruginibacter sp.]